MRTEATSVAAPPAAGPSVPLPPAAVWRASRKVQVRKVREWLIEAVLFLAASSSILITFGIIAILLYESVRFFADAPVLEFLTGARWAPEFEPPRYGILPLLTGTLMITLIALMVAMPVGTISAIYLSEYAPHKVRETLKPVLELLSAVPTVVYGYFALLFVTPLLQKLIPGLGGFNMLAAGLVMGIMIIPYISSLSEDAMHAVPMHMREGSYAMGATRMQTSLRVVVPSAFSGITAAYILGISRALGETMVVAIAAGGLRQITADPRQQAQTITAYIVQVSQGDLVHGSTAYRSIFAAGMALFLITLAFNVGGFWLRKRYREAY